MPIYRFKVHFEEYEDTIRVLEIRTSQTFEELHLAIQDAVGFDKAHPASFYMSNDRWIKGQEITLADMGHEEEDRKVPLIMSECKMKDHINDPHQKIIYIFDFIEMWIFHIELIGITLIEDPELTYPACVKSIGPAPKQYDKSGKFGMVDEEEFNEITKFYLDKSDGIVPEQVTDEEHNTNSAGDENDDYPVSELGTGDEEEENL